MVKRIDDQLLRLSESRFARGAKKLRDGEAFRVAVGSYRIVYRVNQAEQRITVTRIRHRREAYR